MFKVVYKKKALKAIKKMPKKIARQFFNAFDELAENNEEGLDVKKLSGRDGRRLRIGDYRAIYTIDGEQLIILILDAGPRGGIYK
ncbi:MAG: type II toxin-antitoxin system RelE/ParE family toxin [Gammaproteobacteria bacterium]